MADAAKGSSSEKWLCMPKAKSGKMADSSCSYKWPRLGLLALLLALFAAHNVSGQEVRHRNGGRNGEEKIPYSQ